MKKVSFFPRNKFGQKLACGKLTGYAFDYRGITLVVHKWGAINGQAVWCVSEPVTGSWVFKGGMVDRELGAPKPRSRDATMALSTQRIEDMGGVSVLREHLRIKSLLVKRANETASEINHAQR